MSWKSTVNETKYAVSERRVSDKKEKKSDLRYELSKIHWQIVEGLLPTNSGQIGSLIWCFFNEIAHIVNASWVLQGNTANQQRFNHRTNIQLRIPTIELKEQDYIPDWIALGSSIRFDRQRLQTKPQPTEQLWGTPWKTWRLWRSYRGCQLVQ